jgi:hypothetical protein
MHCLDFQTPNEIYKFLLSIFVELSEVSESDFNNTIKKETKHRPLSLRKTPQKNFKVHSASYEALPFVMHWKQMLQSLQISINHFKVYFQILKRNKWPMGHEHEVQFIGLHISRYRAYNAMFVNDKEHEDLCKVFNPCYIITCDNIDGTGFKRNHNDCQLINSFVVGKSNGKWNLFYKYNQFVTHSVLCSDHLARYVNEEMQLTIDDFYNYPDMMCTLYKLFCARKWPKVVIS